MNVCAKISIDLNTERNRVEVRKMFASTRFKLVLCDQEMGYLSNIGTNYLIEAQTTKAKFYVMEL